MSTRPRELNPCSSILFSLFRFISSFSINNLPCTHIHVLCKQLIAIYHDFISKKSTKSNFQFLDEKIANLSKIKLAPKEKNSVTRFVSEKQRPIFSVKKEVSSGQPVGSSLGENGQDSFLVTHLIRVS